MKKYEIIILLLLLHIHIQCIAQLNIVGSVISTDGECIMGASIKVYDAQQALMAYAISNAKGRYLVTLNDTTDSYITITCSSLGHKNATRKIHTDSISQSIDFILHQSDIEIKEVVVKAPAIRTIGDTIQYNVGSFMSSTDRNIEDVIKRLPGIQVEENGQIFYNGESINKFYIEDLDLLGGRYTIATRNISPKDIASISIYENHQSKQVLKEITTSDKAALNLKLKDNKKLKPIGYAQIGGGYGDEINWLAELFGMIISPTNQTIATVKGNNSGNSYIPETQILTSTNTHNTISEDIFTQYPFGEASIPDNRYLRNQSATTTLNTLFKVNKNSSISAYIDYTYDANHYNNNVITRYISDNNNTIQVIENNHSQLKNHIANIRVKYENNSNNLYVLEELKINGKINDNLYNVANNTNIKQSLNTNNYNITNDFTTIIRNNNNLYEIKSLVCFSNTPRNYIDVTNTNKEEFVFRQTAEGLAFYTKESTSFSWLLGHNSQLGSDITFEARYDEFYSKHFQSDNISNNENRNKGYKIITSIVPFYQFKNEHITWRTEIPVRMYNIGYEDILNSSDYILNKPFIDVRSSINFNFLGHIKSVFTIGREHNIGDIDNIIINPINTTYRQQIVMGAGIIGERANNYTSFTATYRNSLSGFFGSLRAMYNIIKSNTISSSYISSQNSTYSNINTSNKGSNASIILNISKNKRSWNTTFSLSGSAIYLRRQTYRQNEMLNIKSQIYSIAADIHSTFWEDRISANINCRYGTSIQYANEMNTIIDELTMSCNITLSPIKNWDIFGKLYFNLPEPSISTMLNNTFIDCGTRYKFNKITFELTGSNLTNKHIYTYTQISNYDQYIYSFSLRPIEILFSVRYDF